MSTRSSIVYGNDVHLYHELLDENEYDVHLELKSKCECHGSTTVTIPAHIWETIRHHGAVPFDLAKMSEDQLLVKVSREVDERIAEYNAEVIERSKSMLNFIGSGIFGGADKPREDQINHGMEYYGRKKAMQETILAKMAELKVVDHSW